MVRAAVVPSPTVGGDRVVPRASWALEDAPVTERDPRAGGQPTERDIMIKGRRIAAGCVVALLALTGCGKTVDKLAEKATGCKNIDAQKGKAECNGVNVDASGNAKLPADFPKELAPPAGTKLYSAIKTDTGGTTAWAVTGTIQGKTADVAKALESQWKKAGYKISENSIASGSDGTGGSIVAQNDTYQVRAGFGQNTVNSKDGGVYLTLTVSELSAAEKDAASSSSDSSSSSSASDDTGSVSSTGGGSTAPGASVPDGFPSGLAPPKGAKVVSGFKTTSNGKDTYAVSYGVDRSVKDAYGDVKAQVTGAGYDVVVDQLTTSGSQSFGTLQAKKGDATVNVIVGADTSQGSGKQTTVTITTG